MMTTRRFLPFLSALLFAAAACADAVAPSRDLLIVPASATINLSDAKTNGVAATFTNRTASSVTVLSTSCLGGRIILERAVPGGWVPVPPPDVVCAAASVMAPVQIDVAAGASVTLRMYALELSAVSPGSFRMRVRTTGGDAYSGLLTVE